MRLYERLACGASSQQLLAHLLKTHDVFQLVLKSLSSQSNTSSGTPPEVRTSTQKLGGTSVTPSSKSKMAALCINSEKAGH